MKQFTSHIDFSLTRKRLEMMIKHYSPIRSNSIKVLIAPVLIGLSLLFCTQQNTESGLKAIEFRSGYEFIYYKSDPVLYFKEEEEVEYPFNKRFDPILYNQEGERFTGIRSFYNRMTKETAWEDHIKDGIMTKTQYVSQEIIDSTGVDYKLYVYKDGRYVTETEFNSNDELISRHEFVQDTIRSYGPDDQLTYQAITEIKNGKEWIYQKSWHPNGNLAVESTAGTDSTGFQMLSIHYDEEGNIEDQIQFKDGELIEEDN